MPIRNLFEPGSGMEKFGSGIWDPHHWKTNLEEDVGNIPTVAALEASS